MDGLPKNLAKGGSRKPDKGGEVENFDKTENRKNTERSKNKTGGRTLGSPVNASGGLRDEGLGEGKGPRVGGVVRGREQQVLSKTNDDVKAHQ